MLWLPLRTEPTSAVARVPEGVVVRWLLDGIGLSLGLSSGVGLRFGVLISLQEPYFIVKFHEVNATIPGLLLRVLNNIPESKAINSLNRDPPASYNRHL